jgi:hypothetical protein
MKLGVQLEWGGRSGFLGRSVSPATPAPKDQARVKNIARLALKALVILACGAVPWIGIYWLIRVL